MSEDKIKLISICIFFAILCFWYGNFLCNNKDFKDPLLYKLGILDLDGWSIIHILQFMLLGFLFPKYFNVAISLGIVWELFEFYLQYNKPNWLKDYGNCKNDIWWHGKLSDIFCNILGFYLGLKLKNKVVS